MEILYKIFDLIGNLYSSNKTNKKERFKNFVEPLIPDLNIVHTDYVETFLQYLTTINTSDKELSPSHPLFETILIDSIRSDDIRKRIFSFYDTNHFKDFEAFAKSIFNYFASLYDAELVYSNMVPVLEKTLKMRNYVA